MAAAKAERRELPAKCRHRPFQVRPLFQSETCRTGGWKFQDPDGNVAFIQFQLDVNS